MNAHSFLPVLDGVGAAYCLHLTEGLVHFLWQGCVIAALYAVASRSLRSRSANARYLVGVVALVLMAACLPVTLWVVPVPGVSHATGNLIAEDAIPAVPPPIAMRSEVVEERLPPVPLAVLPKATQSRPAAIEQAPPRRSIGDATAALLATAAPYAAAVYLCGVVLMLLRLALSLWAGRRLRQGCTPISDAGLLAILLEHGRRLGLRVVPLAAYCGRISAPVVVGVLRPMILLPAVLATGLTPPQLEAVLLHELAHVRRYDLLINILQRFIEAVLFFHPAVWWVSHRVSASARTPATIWQFGRTMGAFNTRQPWFAWPSFVRRSARSRRHRQPCWPPRARNSSQLKSRVVRLLGVDERPRLRLTTAGLLVSALLFACVVVAPVAWRNAARADQESKTSAPQKAEAKGKAISDRLQPVSMSAVEFGQLSLSEQRDVLAQVFKQRLEHLQNLYYESEQRYKSYENQGGEPGKEIDLPSHVVYRRWRLGDSFRMDSDYYDIRKSAEPSNRHAQGLNADEGIGRNTTIWQDKEHPSQGQVQYPVDESVSGDRYFYWVGRESQQNAIIGQALFPYLIAHKDELAIKAPVENGKVQLSVPWQPQWAGRPGGEQTYLLDPQKGFLPIRCDSRFDDVRPDGKPRWRVEKFVVDEDKRVGDVWMPTKIRHTGIASTVPNTISECSVKILRIEAGTVKPSDIFVPFKKGMQIVDAIEGISYVADAPGNAAWPIKLAPGWQHKPPAGWRQRESAIPSMASRISPDDRKKLNAERAVADKADRERREASESALKVMRSDAPLDDRIDAGLRALRIYVISPNSDDRLWASVIREMILIGKPAVPRLAKELDRTERERTLRALGFVLRGIGDPRAVPALIRAIPRMPYASQSDYGLLIRDDPELAQFMQAHDHTHKPGSPTNKSGHFSYGRPIYEIMPALEQMTGQSYGWKELRFVHLEGAPEQQRIQRLLFLKLAQRWADWWAKNWQKYVKDEGGAQIELTKQSLGQAAAALRTTGVVRPSTFPRGARVTLGERSIDSFIKSFDEWSAEALHDLDTGRYANPPAELIKSSQPNQPSPDLLAWAEREGVDLINIKLKASDGKPYYAFQPVGMKVWRIDNARYAHIEDELRTNNKFELPPLWRGPLAQVDERTGEYDEKLTVSFLFITREGTCGAMQLQAPLSRPMAPGSAAYTNGGLHYKFIYEGAASASGPAGAAFPKSQNGGEHAPKRPKIVGPVGSFNSGTGWTSANDAQDAAIQRLARLSSEINAKEQQRNGNAGKSVSNLLTPPQQETRRDGNDRREKEPAGPVALTKARAVEQSATTNDDDSERFHLVRGGTSQPGKLFSVGPSFRVGGIEAPLVYANYDKRFFRDWGPHMVVLSTPPNRFRPGAIDLPADKLLMQPALQAKLNITPEQKKKLQEISARYWPEREKIAGKELIDMRESPRGTWGVAGTLKLTEKSTAGSATQGSTVVLSGGKSSSVASGTTTTTVKTEEATKSVSPTVKMGKGSITFSGGAMSGGRSTKSLSKETHEKLERQWDNARKEIEAVLTPEQLRGLKDYTFRIFGFGSGIMFDAKVLKMLARAKSNARSFDGSTRIFSRRRIVG